MTEKLTACGECEHKYSSLEAYASFDESAYYSKCGAAKGKFDYIRGALENAYCRNINTDGHCPHFKKKTGGGDG